MEGGEGFFNLKGVGFCYCVTLTLTYIYILLKNRSAVREGYIYIYTVCGIERACLIESW